MKMLHRSIACLWILSVIAPCLANNVSSKTPIHVLGLYPMSGPWAGGEALYPATQLALQDVNNNDEILTNYELKITFADTKVGFKCFSVIFCI